MNVDFIISGTHYRRTRYFTFGWKKIRPVRDQIGTLTRILTAIRRAIFTVPINGETITIYYGRSTTIGRRTNNA